MTTWTLRSLFGVSGEEIQEKTIGCDVIGTNSGVSEEGCREQYNPESLEQRAMMAVVALLMKYAKTGAVAFRQELNFKIWT